MPGAARWPAPGASVLASGALARARVLLSGILGEPVSLSDAYGERPAALFATGDYREIGGRGEARAVPADCAQGCRAVAWKAAARGAERAAAPLSSGPCRCGLRLETAPVRVGAELVATVHLGWTTGAPEPGRDAVALVQEVLRLAAELIGAECETGRLRQAAAAGAARARVLFHHSPAMLAVLGLNGRVQAVNGAFAALLGVPAGALRGDAFERLHAPRERARVRAHLSACLDGAPGEIQRFEGRPSTARGTPRRLRYTVRRLHDAQAGGALLLLAEDRTESHRLSLRLAHQQSHDGATGLLTRQALEERLHHVTLAGAPGSHALLRLDLDHFKLINETCGHAAGDAVLLRLAKLLRAGARAPSTVARLGGAGFAVLVEDCTPAAAHRLAREIRDAVRHTRFHWGDQHFGLSASVGVVPFRGGDAAGAVLRAAESACCAAKEAGGNRLQACGPGDQMLARRHRELTWVSRLTCAMEEGRFDLSFQPIARVGPDATALGAHYELLLRMVDEQGETVLPAQFLASAERYHLVTALDRWVIARAFDWLVRHPRHVDGLYLCSINLSGRSVGDEDFMDFVVRQLDETGVPAQKICFEITETAAVADLAAATRFIRTLKGWGCRFALDDFGAGLSSFAYLKQLAVDYLKIDGMFVRDMARQPMDLAMVRSIHEMGRALGKQTIAEFVEDAAILDKLSEIGVDFAQGFGIGRPQPLDRLD